MMDKGQIMTWRSIGYEAQKIVCLCDENAGVEKLTEMVEGVRTKIHSLDISELEKLHIEKGISIPEYADMISESLTKEPLDIGRTRNCANALLKIVVDMRYGSVQNDEVYKKLAEEGVEYAGG